MVWKLADFGGATALVAENGGEISYSLLKDYTEKLAERIPPRKLVFSLCSNTVGSLVGYVAFLNAGVVPLMLSSDMDSALFARLSEIYKPDYLWMPAESAARLKISMPEKYSAHGYILLKTPYDSEYPLDGDLALLLSTSGSTGDPKLVRQSFKNILSNTNSIVEYLKIDSSERAVTTLPMNYTYGISIINTHFAAGASLALTDRTLMQREFWDFLKASGATSFGGVPYTYEMLERLRFQRMQLPLLRTLTQAGGKLSLELHKKFAQWAVDSKKKFVVMYGQTEATARMAYLPPEKSVEKCGSMGIAIPGGKFRLFGEDGLEIMTPDTAGELVYEGANVAMGYAVCGEDLSRGDEWRGRLATGDIAKFDSDGYFYVVGRKKRFLKIFGNRVNLDEMERILRLEFPEIELACAGADDKMKIYIVSPAAAAEVAAFAAAKTGFNKSAFETVAVASIPKNAAGKILYGELSK